MAVRVSEQLATGRYTIAVDARVVDRDGFAVSWS